jgi:ATP-binding cassette subfamily F protein 3
MKSYAGNYTAYLEQYLTEVEQHWSSYKDQQAEIQRLRKDIARTKEQARWVEITTTSRQPSVRRYAKKVARKALSREKKLERFLESEERVEKPKEHWQMKLDFGQPLSASKDVLQLENLSIGYPDLPPLLTGINLTLRGSERIVLAGQNGSGKTTLIRTIVGELPPVSGRVRIGQNIRIGYMSQEQELLDPQLNALSTIQRHAAMNETEARNFLHYFLFSGDDPLRPISALSYGERARLSLASLVVQGCNLLLLDEPINHLDIPSRERFEQALTSFDGSILAVVHDRYFIDRFATQIWQVDHGTITRHVLVSDI